MRESTVLHQQQQEDSKPEDGQKTSQLSSASAEIDGLKSQLTESEKKSEAKDKEITSLQEKIKDLQSKTAPENKVSNTQSSPDPEPYPRLGFSVKNALDRTIARISQSRMVRGIGGLLGRSTEHRSPNWFLRLFKIPALGVLALPGLTTALPKAVTVGGALRNTGTLLSTSAAAAVPVAVLGATTRTAFDAGRWLGGEGTVDVVAREIAGRKHQISNKGMLEWRSLFTDSDLADVHQTFDLLPEIENIGDFRNLGLAHPEKLRLIKKISELKLNKILLENKLTAGGRMHLSDSEREELSAIDTSYKIVGRLFDEGLSQQEKAYFLQNDFLPYLKRKEIWSHISIIAKRSLAFGIGTGLVGLAASAFKSLSDTGVLAEWGRRISTTVKTGTANLGNYLSNTWHSITVTVGGWFDKLHLPWINSPASILPTTPVPLTPTSVTPGVWKFDVGTILTPSGDKLQVVFPQSP